MRERRERESGERESRAPSFAILEVWGDMGRYGEMWGDVGRHGGRAVVRDLGLQIGAVVLCHRRHVRVEPVLRVQLDALVHEGARHRHLGLHLRQLVLDGLQVGERALEGLRVGSAPLGG